MKSQISRQSHDPAKRYSGVYQQQGRMITDMNVIAHRASSVRFDPVMTYFADWDLLLKLTDDCEPLALPVLAAHYYSDLPACLGKPGGAVFTTPPSRTFRRRPARSRR